jgi:NAD(P)-dependent dehydrogenase (short-subunit alcohol dehydrogenase family)
MVTAGGPSYVPLLEMDSDQVRDALSSHVVLGLDVARSAAPKMKPGGSLTLMGGTGGRRIGHGLGILSAATAALPPFTAALALELAPVRVNLIAAGFVDTPLSASLLGDRLEERRNELRATLPIGRVVGPADVAALAVHIMTNWRVVRHRRRPAVRLTNSRITSLASRWWTISLLRLRFQNRTC